MSEYYYFASDFHLGSDLVEKSKLREQRIIRWLDHIQATCKELFILGDMFDYWFEYKKVVPKGFVGLLSKLNAFTDQDIPVHVFTGNHDMWMFDYLQEEIGVQLYKEPITKEIEGKSFFLGHGDGLGPGDHGYKFIKKVFASRVNQTLFSWLHPDIGISLMKYFSRTSRDEYIEEKFRGPEKEWLVQFCEETIKETVYDYFIFGHRHIAIDHQLSNNKSRYINLGDWISLNTYARYGSGQLELLKYDK